MLMYSPLPSRGAGSSCRRMLTSCGSPPKAGGPFSNRPARLGSWSARGLDLVIVAICNLWTAMVVDGDGRENRTQELTAITRALRGLAKDLEVPVLAVSQLSREVEKRGKTAADKRPVLADRLGLNRARRRRRHAGLSRGYYVARS